MISNYFSGNFLIWGKEKRRNRKRIWYNSEWYVNKNECLRKFLKSDHFFGPNFSLNFTSFLCFYSISSLAFWASSMRPPFKSCKSRLFLKSESKVFSLNFSWVRQILLWRLWGIFHPNIWHYQSWYSHSRCHWNCKLVFLLIRWRYRSNLLV